MTDIVQRLREIDERDCFIPDKLCHEAADEIEQLRSVLEKITALRHSNSSAASIAQSALDTMRALDKL